MFSWVISALFLVCSYFLIKTCYYFFIKNRCSVLHYIFKKKFILINKTDREKKWRNACMIETQNIILKIYVISFPIYHLHCWICVVIYCIKNYRCHSLSFAVIRCHSFSLVAIRCHLLSFVVTRCHSMYHSFFFL